METCDYIYSFPFTHIVLSSDCLHPDSKHYLSLGHQNNNQLCSNITQEHCVDCHHDIWEIYIAIGPVRDNHRCSPDSYILCVTIYGDSQCNDIRNTRSGSNCKVRRFVIPK